jgi:hypothetical protein
LQLAQGGVKRLFGMQNKKIESQSDEQVPLGHQHHVPQLGKRLASWSFEDSYDDVEDYLLFFFFIFLLLFFRDSFNCTHFHDSFIHSSFYQHPQPQHMHQQHHEKTCAERSDGGKWRSASSV